eukprot:8826746-Pyramimonas_sp.AAC.1
MPSGSAWIGDWRCLGSPRAVFKPSWADPGTLLSSVGALLGGMRSLAKLSWPVLGAPSLGKRSPREVEFGFSGAIFEPYSELLRQSWHVNGPTGRESQTPTMRKSASRGPLGGPLGAPKSSGRPLGPS